MRDKKKEPKKKRVVPTPGREPPEMLSRSRPDGKMTQKRSTGKIDTAVFLAVEDLAVDYPRLWTAIREADKAMEAITAATSDRIKADRQAADERADILTRQSADPSRNAIVRKIAAQELQRLQARTHGSSEDEVAAFAAEMRNALDALSGARETGSKLSAALKAAAAEVDKIWAECNGFGDLGLVKNWLDGDQRRFDALGKTGRPGDVS